MSVMWPSSAEQIADFDKRGNDAMAWVASADRLLVVADILKERRTPLDAIIRGAQPPSGFGEASACLSSELMLRGYAVECLMKALYRKRNMGLLAKDGRFMRIPGTGDHDLLQLGQVLALSFSPPEEDMLKRLHLYVVAYGRYPIATGWEATKIKEHLRGKSSPGFWVLGDDDTAFQQVIASLKGQLGV